jgi:hypothetical protein
MEQRNERRDARSPSARSAPKIEALGPRGQLIKWKDREIGVEKSLVFGACELALVE